MAQDARQTVTLEVDVAYRAGARPPAEQLTEAVAEHVRRSGDFVFPVDGEGGAFASSRWIVADARVV